MCMADRDMLGDEHREAGCVVRCLMSHDATLMILILLHDTQSHANASS